MTQTHTLYLCAVAVFLSAAAASMKMRAPVGSASGRVASVALTTGFRPARPRPLVRRLQPHEFFQISENLRKTAFSMCYRDVVLNGDACYGCFMRATNELQCNGTETRLRNCTTEYLDGTPFGDCANALENNSNDTGVCEFEECIRKADTNELIRECMEEVETTHLTPDSFLDMTTCILAKARCRMNRNQLQFGGMEPLNALLVTDSKEFRVVDVPGGYIGGYECRAHDYMNPRVTKPARWRTVSCGGTC